MGASLAPERGMRTLAALLACLALVKLGLHLLTSGQYGYHRDELYYLASAAHLDLGYVDYPPVTPFLGRLALLLFGDSLLGLRMLPALAGAAAVVLTGLLAGVLSGRLWAQGLAALAVLASPIFLGANLLFQTVSFDQLAWAGVTYAVARVLRDGGGRWWLVTGAAFGVGLLTKYTIAAFGLAILIGLLATSARGQLRTPWPYLAGLLAALLFAPNVVWQIGHDWSSLQYVRTHHGAIESGGGPLAYLVEQIPLAGPAGLVLLVVGARYLLGSVQFRALGVAAIVVEVLLLLGEAGALDRFGPAYGLPPVVSPHLTYYYWKPAHVRDDPVITVGYSAEQLQPWFSRVDEAATLGNRAGVRNEEVGRHVFVCREPRVPLDQVWPELHAFD